MKNRTRTSLACDRGRRLPASPERWAVAGLGKTGLSVARFLAARGIDVVAFDTRVDPPNLASLRREVPAATLHTGGIPEGALADVHAVVVSPGITLQLPAFESARKMGVPVFGDIELFARHATAPYIGITGSNGKSTVATLVAEMIACDGRTVKAGGNLGTPALDLLEPPAPEYYVLELSSFQLESTQSLAAEVACILNITPDHLDRHRSLHAYAQAKARILDNARHLVLNADDPLVASLTKRSQGVIWISTTNTSAANYSVGRQGTERWLMRGSKPVLPTSKIQINGTHNEFNALAAIAITDLIGVSRRAQCDVLEKFPGLEHRCRLVAERDGISWFNDSKGTNIGAAAAAIAGIFNSRAGVLIAGGQGKGADFNELCLALANRVHSAVLIGEDAARIEAAIRDTVAVYRARDMRDAVEQALKVVRPREAVLLSPACASFDMFANYEARGRAFEAAVRELLRT